MDPQESYLPSSLNFFPILAVFVDTLALSISLMGDYINIQRK
jgi:hypothetical protein